MAASPITADAMPQAHRPFSAQSANSAPKRTSSSETFGGDGLGLRRCARAQPRLRHSTRIAKIAPMPSGESLTLSTAILTIGLRFKQPQALGTYLVEIIAVSTVPTITGSGCRYPVYGTADKAGVPTAFATAVALPI